jgi:hypothetical protein
MTNVATNSFVFWNKMLCALVLFFYFLYSSILNMEVICSCETLLDFQLNTWHYTPRDRQLYIVTALRISGSKHN